MEVQGDRFEVRYWAKDVRSYVTIGFFFSYEVQEASRAAAARAVSGSWYRVEPLCRLHLERDAPYPSTRAAVDKVEAGVREVLEDALFAVPPDTRLARVTKVGVWFFQPR
jgi:hypothetical protein